MLNNMWKKIREKNASNSSQSDAGHTSLVPRHDGPLMNFSPSKEDCFPLEKGRLTPSFTVEDLKNPCLFNYFYEFLETKNQHHLLKLPKSPDHPPRSPHKNDWSELSEQIASCSENKSQSVNNSPEKSADNGATYSIDSTLISSKVLQEFWDEFTRSSYFFKYQVELLTSRNVTLGDIMEHPPSFNAFVKFLESENLLTVLEFWLAVKEFKQRFVETVLNQTDGEKNASVENAMCIYEKYLSLEATCPLGFSAEIRYAIEEGICADKYPKSDCFDVACDIAIAFLRCFCRPLFLSSQSFVYLLSDTIRSCGKAHSNHSPVSSVSECSADGQTVSQYNPDFLWKKRQANGLSLGKVDRFGRFMSDIEPNPDLKTSSRFRRAFSSFGNRSRNSMQEEMAWQVAEMVIKDVTSLTLGCDE